MTRHVNGGSVKPLTRGLLKLSSPALLILTSASRIWSLSKLYNKMKCQRKCKVICVCIHYVQRIQGWRWGSPWYYNRGWVVTFMLQLPLPGREDAGTHYVKMCSSQNWFGCKNISEELLSSFSENVFYFVDAHSMLLPNFDSCIYKIILSHPRRQ